MLTKEIERELVHTARALVFPGKGILAADESPGTVAKRFAPNGIQNTEENRAAYRSLLFETEGIENHISGSILYEETMFQTSPMGVPILDLMKEKNIIIGIKLDKGVKPIGNTNGEVFTQGLDNLDSSCKRFYDLGARFSKWRCVLKIDDGCPSELSILTTAQTLAQYASICQQNGLVPIVEPEILQDGSHSIETCAEVSQRVLSACFKALNDHKVLLEGCLLKPNMVTSGVDCETKADVAAVAYYTVRTLQRTVPPALPGVVFLSGGSSEEMASSYLNAINQFDTVKPWKLSFSYGRALQATCIKTWAGSEEQKEAAQKALLLRAQANSEATLGKYKSQESNSVSNETLYVRGYVY